MNIFQNSLGSIAITSQGIFTNIHVQIDVFGIQSVAGLHTVRFDFFCVLYSRIEAKKYPVGFPTRHQRRFYSVFCKLVPVYLLVTI